MRARDKPGIGSGRKHCRLCPILPGGWLKEKVGISKLLRCTTSAAHRLSCSRSRDQALVSFAGPAYITGQQLEKEIAKAEPILKRPSARPRRHASRSKAAVRVAHELLVWWNHEAPVTRGGKWEQLAKIFAGGLNVDFFEHLRVFKRSRGPRRCGAKTGSFINRVDGNQAPNNCGIGLAKRSLPAPELQLHAVVVLEQQCVDPNLSLRNCLTGQFSDQIESRTSESGCSLRRMRPACYASDGPSYVKLGRSVRYSEGALNEWMKSRVRLSTSDH